MTTNKIRCEFRKHTDDRCVLIADNKIQLSEDSEVGYLCTEHYELNQQISNWLFGIPDVVFKVEGWAYIEETS